MSTPRTGRGIADIDPDRLARLNAGTIEAATLTECLAIDFAGLMRATLPELGDEAIIMMQLAAGEGITRRMALAARLIIERQGMSMLGQLSRHPADSLRGWGCFVIGAVPDLSLPERLTAIGPLAEDPHFGVREWAWLAMRQHIAGDLDQAVRLLAAWSLSPSERLRRFASEATRPRGVWCPHLTVLKQNPAKALPILEPLRADPSAYVQDSVGNWLNDAGKDQPHWVMELCARWQAENPQPATLRICKRALRSLRNAA